jgi:hypothetical protein
MQLLSFLAVELQAGRSPCHRALRTQLPVPKVKLGPFVIIATINASKEAYPD